MDEGDFIWLIKEFIELKRVRKCTTQKDDIFVLEEFGKLFISLFLIEEKIKFEYIWILRSETQANYCSQIQIINGKFIYFFSVHSSC